MTDPASQLIASPLTLIKRAADVDRTATDVGRYEEALLLSYTADFGFLDTVAVPLLRSIGARVTAVGDVNMASFDPRTAPRAGQGFNPAYAHCPGAFHPKLLVLASNTNTRIAIGSGNSTMAGWSYNHELWTVASGSPAASPALSAQLADWLDLLPAAVRFSAGVEDRLHNIAALLRSAHASSGRSDNEPTLVSSLEVPIIDQLPYGPVDELCLFAPFFDADGAALARLIERFQPASVTVTVQPTMGSFDGTALLAVLGGVEARALLDNDPRYRHGKLIEWSRGERRWALTGSANISRSALLRAQIDGGNCELGIVTEISTSLMPFDTTQPTTAEIRQITISRAPSVVEPYARLLGAHLVEDGLRVQLVEPLSEAAGVQYLNPGATQWIPIAAAPAHHDVFVVPESLAPGTRLRLASTGDHAEFSNVVVVVDLAATTSRRSDVSTEQSRYQPSSIFVGDLLTRFLEDLQALRADLKSVTVPDTAAHSVAVNPADSDGTSEVEAYAQRVGLPMVDFALGAETEEPAYATDGEWAQLDDDDADTDLEELTAAEEVLDDRSPIANLATAATENPRRYRRWADSGVSMMPALTATGRLAVVRLIIWMMAARVWEDDDIDSVLLLARALTSLASEPTPIEIEASAGSLGAVALAILDRKVDQRHGTAASLAVRKARDEIGYLLPALDSDRVSAYLRYLSSAEVVTGLGFTLEVDDIIEIADQVVQDDDIADALARLLDAGRDAYRPSPSTLHISATTTRPDLVALEAISYAEKTDMMAAWCSTPTKWALVLWRRPDFIVVNGTASGPPKWQHFRTARVTLRAVVHGERSHSDADRIYGLAERVPHTPWVMPVPLGLEILSALGLPDLTPPSQQA
ncbi:hypothetical protein AB0876_09780 [Mycobacterium sp. NPDC049093]